MTLYAKINSSNFKVNEIGSGHAIVHVELRFLKPEPVTLSKAGVGGVSQRDRAKLSCGTLADSVAKLA